MKLSRRRFLQWGGTSAAALIAPSWPRLARASLRDPVLVVIYLRGAADGLNLVVPADDPDYYALRPDIQVAQGAGIPLDGFYTLNPLLAHLMPMYLAGDLAIVHAVGNHDNNRSHFDSQDMMEQAAPGDSAVVDGWLNRMLPAIGVHDAWSGVSFGPSLALALRGENPSVAIRSLEKYAFAGTAEQRAALESLYSGAEPRELARAAEVGFAALDVIGGVPRDPRVAYPAGAYGDALGDAASLIRADVGVRAVSVDLLGWDHHSAAVQGLASLAPEFGAGLAALRADLGEHWQRTIVLAMTEFGRAAAQNGAFGTDHGHASVMLVAGGGVAGGRVITRGGWPGLAREKRFEGRGLAVTTDYRDVFGEVLNAHMRISRVKAAAVLAGHEVRALNFPGLFG